MTKKFLIRDNCGKVYNTVKIPGVVIDCQTKTLLKIGEVLDMEYYYNFARCKYIEAGLVNEANSLALIFLPHDQEEIDKIFQNTGYVEKYIPPHGKMSTSL